MADEAVSVANSANGTSQNGTAVPALVPPPAKEPNLLLVGALATAGIVALCGAALYFWPKPEATKRPVRPRRPSGEPRRLSGAAKKKSRSKPPKRRRPRRRKPMKGLPRETEATQTLDDDGDG